MRPCTPGSPSSGSGAPVPASRSRRARACGSATPWLPRAAARASRACPTSPQPFPRVCSSSRRWPTVGPNNSSATARCSWSGRPRRYLGRDVYWWLNRIGQLDERWDEVENLQRARRHASVQLVGDDEGRDLDLHTLAAGAVRVVGRLSAVRSNTALCSGGLGALVANADLKLARLLRTIDEFVDAHMLDVGPPAAPVPSALPDAPTSLEPHRRTRRRRRRARR